MKKKISSNKKKRLSRLTSFATSPMTYVDPGGLEPPFAEPESDVLATTLWVKKKKNKTLPRQTSNLAISPLTACSLS